MSDGCGPAVWLIPMDIRTASLGAFRAAVAGGHPQLRGTMWGKKT